MVVVVGDTPADADQHLQDVDQREVVACSGAGFVQVRSAALAAKDTATAVRRPWAERRPIVLNIPTDIQRLDVDPPEMHSTEPQRPTVVPDPAQLDRAVGLIYSARRPIIVAGRGAVMSEARTALLELGALIGAPVATTLGAKDYFAGDRWNLGLFGTLSTDVATSIIADCDCVIFFGAGVNRFTASDGAFLEKKRVIQVDVDPRRLGRHYPIDVGVVGDAATTANTMKDWLADAGVERTPPCSAALEESLGAYSPASEFEDQSTEAAVDTRTALIRLDAMLPADRTVTCDAGQFCVPTWRYLHVPEPAAFVWANNFGSVGLAMAEGIGAAAAAPHRPVVAVMGDGGFMMGGLLEFNTAVRHRLDLITVVINDGGYGAEYHHVVRHDLDRSLPLMSWPDFAAVATSLGGTGITVRSLAELEAAAQAITERDRPLLIDIHVDMAVAAASRGL
jgi:thiamine pyrophosphate-dependent acetolactate synthase large subunit-like protein